MQEKFWTIVRVLTAILFLMPVTSNAFERYNRVVKYDKYFSKYSKRYFGPGFNWHYFKAQAVAESRLQADARSRVGALGVMQIMPKTFAEITKKNQALRAQENSLAGT